MGGFKRYLGNAPIEGATFSAGLTLACVMVPASVMVVDCVMVLTHIMPVYFMVINHLPLKQAQSQKSMLLVRLFVGPSDRAFGRPALRRGGTGSLDFQLSIFGSHLLSPQVERGCPNEMKVEQS